jgi:acetyltransferase
MNQLRPDLAPFLAPRTAVILGASERNGVARNFLRNLAAGGCVVTGTHPRDTTFRGARVAPTVADLGEAPDIACVALGATTIGPAIEEAVAAGIRHLVVPGLGPEAGVHGDGARAHLEQLCVAHDLSVIGPNGMGVLVPGGASAWTGSVVPSMRPGGVGILVESGSIGEALTGIGPRIGIRTIISSGNETSRDAADILAFLADDPETRAIGLMLETIRRPAAFRAALDLAAHAGKPVVAVKTGTSEVGAERALAHSGAIAGSEAAFDALCRAYGVIRTLDYGDWVEALELVGGSRRLRGSRIVVISNSGGEGEHAADAAERAGMPLVPLPADLAAALDDRWALHGAANPLDYYAFAPQEEILPDVMAAAAAHPDVDGVLLNIDQSWRFVGNERETNLLAASVAVQTAAASPDTFVGILSTSTNDASDEVLTLCGAAGVPVLMGHGPAFRAMAAMARGTVTEPRTIRADDSPGPLPRQLARPAPTGAGPLPEHDSKAWLAAYGLRAPLERRARGVDEAVAAAEEIGYPVVVKADGPAHKEREGGVHLGCATPAMVARATEACNGAVLVAQQLGGGVEVLCGLVRDPLCGTMVVCGVGGSWAEAMRESARTAVAPLTRDQAVALVRDVVPVARRLDEAGIAAVAATLVALGEAAADEPRISEIDINPLRVVGGDAVALDALIVLTAESEVEG